jgi:hypothetical protein
MQVLISIRGDKGEVHDLLELEHDLEHEDESLTDQESKAEAEVNTDEQD